MSRNIVWISTRISSRAIAFFFFRGLFYFLEGTDIASYANNTTTYNVTLTQELQSSTKLLRQNRKSISAKKPLFPQTNVIRKVLGF